MVRVITLVLVSHYSIENCSKVIVINSFQTIKTHLTRNKFTVVAVIVICWFCSQDAIFESTGKITLQSLFFVAHCLEAYSVKADECTSKL